jgi:hypothetical protein
MSIFDGKTKKEIAALTEEQVEAEAKVCLMENGIPLGEPMPPGEAPEEANFRKSVTGFKVNHFDLFFVDRESAQRLADFLNSEAQNIKKSECEWRIGYDFKWLEPISEGYAVEAEQFYRQNEILEKEERLTKQKTAREQFEREKREYNKQREDRSKAVNWVWDTWRDARDFQSTVDRVAKGFGEYVALCNADECKAFTFFKKAWKDRVNGSEKWRAICEELCELYALKESVEVIKAEARGEE